MSSFGILYGLVVRDTQIRALLGEPHPARTRSGRRRLEASLPSSTCTRPPDSAAPPRHCRSEATTAAWGPGYGLSPKPSARELGLFEQSALLGGFVAALDLRDVTLVFARRRRSVGVDFAAAHPEQVRALVLANTFAWRPGRAALRVMLRLVRRQRA